MRRGTWIAIFVGAVVGLSFSLRPWQVYREQRKEADAAAQALRKAEASRAEYLRAEARLKTPLGREEAARRAGWVPPGERLAEEVPVSTPAKTP